MARRPADRYIRYYTDGSAARQLEVEVPRRERRPLPKVKKQPKRVVYIQPLAVGGVIVALAMLGMMIAGAAQLMQTQQQVQLMRAHVDKLTETNEELTKKYEQECDLEQIKQSALALGMVPEAEVPQVSISVDIPQAQPQQITLWERIGNFFTGLFA